MINLFKFILNGNLKLKNFVCVILILNGLANLLGFLVHGSLEEGLSVVHLVLVNLWEELGKLIIHICRVTVVLNLIIAVSEKGEGSSVSWLELKLVGEDVDNLD